MSVQFSRWVVFESLRSHGLQHPRPPLSITNSQSFFKLMSIELVMPSNHLILCRPLLLLPSIFPSIRVLSNESALHIRWPKDWNSASASVLPKNIQDWNPLGWTVWISFQPKGFWEKLLPVLKALKKPSLVGISKNYFILLFLRNLDSRLL